MHNYKGAYESKPWSQKLRQINIINMKAYYGVLRFQQKSISNH